MAALLDQLSVRMTMVILSQPAPIMVASPLNLIFNTMQGQSSTPAQVVSITNTGEGKLYWNMDWIMDCAETNRVWLSPSLTHGVVSPGQTEQVTILAITHGVAPGVHRGYIDFWQVDSHGTVWEGIIRLIWANSNKGYALTALLNCMHLLW